MNENPAPLILCVDDDPDILKLLERYLKPAGYRLHFESDPVKGLTAAKGQKPALILVDLMMPQMSGYQFCERLQEDEGTAYTPVIFVTASTKQEDRQKALSSGAVDYLEKPIKKEDLLVKIEACLNAGKKWSSLPFSTKNWAETISPAQYLGFREWLLQKFNIEGEKKVLLDSLSSADIYLFSQAGALAAPEIAKAMAEYLKLDYLPQINPEKIKLGVLPSAFSRRNEVVALSGESNQLIFLVSNPFNLELLSLLENYDRGGKGVKLSITEPAKIRLLFESQTRNDVEASGETVSSQVITKRERIEVTRLTQDQVEKYPVMHIANNILYSAVEERTSDIHIEPKEENTLVRFRVDGDMRDMFKLKKKTGDMLISRFKAMGGLDIAERRKPQDGGLEAIISERNFKMRLATSSTPDGESLVIRLLEPSVKPAPLTELGMTLEQTGLMQDLASRSQGVVLIVGPTGSGKTTTIYSFLSQIDTKSRSLITVEDPVEYRIPYANQQQVNEKAGVTFEALLKSAVRQDPDIMFLGEIRDPYSAKMALDFASSGHLTISTIHSSNAISAVFRLERLGVGRDAIADSVLAIVAQRLIKKLCPYCKKVEPSTVKEQERIAPFLTVKLEQVAHPAGCDKCGQTGFYGREGIYEVLYFDAEISDKVRSGRPLDEIRNFIRQRGGFLIGQHAARKVKDLIFSPEEAESRVLAEERSNISGQVAGPVAAPEKTEPVRLAYKKDETAVPLTGQNSILVADDDPDTKNLVQRLLEKHGCRVVSAGDGYDALMAVSNQRFDLIVSDIDMPNLDGLKLLDIINQKNILTPVMFLTGSSDEQVEVKALEMGAVEFVQKPFKPEALWARINKLLSAKISNNS